MQDILKLCCQQLDLSFSFSYREGNQAADLLAVDTRRKVCPPGWVSSPSPYFLLQLNRDRVAIDLNPLCTAQTSAVHEAHEDTGIG